MRLSPKQAENLLVRNIDKVPVYLVVKQLKDETELLHWCVPSVSLFYLHHLLEGICTHWWQMRQNCTILRNMQNFTWCRLAPLWDHLLNSHQVSLYAHFAPKSISPKSSKSAEYPLTKFRDPREPLISSTFLESLNSFDEETNFLRFLKFSNFVPLEVVSLLPSPLKEWQLPQALRECDRQSPPLYREKIYILAKMGNAREGLSILLREVGDVKMAIHYLEVGDRSCTPLTFHSNTILISGKMLWIMPWPITTSWWIPFPLVWLMDL